MKFSTVGSLLGLLSLVVSGSDAFSSLRTAPSIVRKRSITDSSYRRLRAASTDDWYDNGSVSSRAAEREQAQKEQLDKWFQEQVQQQKRELGIDAATSSTDTQRFDPSPPPFPPPEQQQVPQQKELLKQVKRQMYDQQSQQRQEISTATSSAAARKKQWFEEQVNQQQREKTYDQQVQPQVQQRQVIETTPTSTSTTARKTPKSIEMITSFVANLQSAVVGTVVGTWAVLPVTAFHYLVFSEYTYTTFAQWEWDLIAAAIQGGLFATVYRYALRQDVEDATLQNRVLWAFIILKSLVRVEVPAECAAGPAPLYCVTSEPFYVVSESMMAELAMNCAESLFLFGATAAAMNWLLKRNWIRPYSE